MEQNRGSCWVVPVVSFELCADDSIDVLKDDESGSHDPDSFEDEGEEVSFVCVSLPLSGCAEGLAWKSSRQDIKTSSKFFDWEGFKIRPDSSFTQGSRFHFLKQVEGSEGFDLHMNSEANIEPSKFESDSDTIVS